MKSGDGEHLGIISQTRPPEERKAIAMKGAHARWAKNGKYRKRVDETGLRDVCKRCGLNVLRKCECK